MKTLQFTKPLLRKVLCGNKSQTRRHVCYSYLHKPINRFKVGDVCMLKNSRFSDKVWGYVRIESIRTEELGWITQEDAKLEGFASVEDFRNAWISIHGAFAPGRLVNVITFKLVPNPLEVER